MDRAQQLLRSLSKDARVIEIGPGFSPLAPKRDGWNTFVIDHAPREELARKYHEQAIDRIEEVDLVWTGGSIADAIPGDLHGTFDAFIASHVIEHTTDIVTFLRAAETLLRPDGIVILAVPDKRKCFDCFRSLSATADAIAAFVEKRDRHTLRTQIDYALNMALKSGTDGAWAGGDTRRAEPVNALTDAPQWRDAAQLPEYADAHAWVFVPASFSLMVLELSQLGYIDLRVEDVQERGATEFFAWLRKGSVRLAPEEARRQRTALMERIVVELAEQSRQLADSPMSRFVPTEALQEALLRAGYHTDALKAVLGALTGSIRPLGLNRSKFERLIDEAIRDVPNNLSAAVQRRVLRSEATWILDRRTVSTEADDEDRPLERGGVLVVPLSAAQFGDPLLADEIARERQRTRAVRAVLDAVLDSTRSRALDKRRFKALVREAARTTPSDGPEAVRHTVLYEESRKVLGLRGS